MSKLLPASGFKWLDAKRFEDASNSFKIWVLKVDLKYPKELGEVHSDYPLAPEKIEIKREMISDNQLKIADHCNIPISNVKN